MTYFALIVSLVIGVGSLAFPYAGAGEELAVRGLLFFGLFWLYAAWRRWAWFSALGILFLVGLAGYGLWIGFSPGWMIAGSLGALMAWDLSEFLRRMDAAPKSEDLLGMQWRHITRLTIIAAIGVALASISMAVRLEFTLESMMLLALVAVLGLMQLVGWVRKK